MQSTIYERIRHLRINAGMSQEDLAHAMGYKDRSMIAKIESGKVDISQRKIITDEMPVVPYDQPKNDDVRLLIRGLNKLSPEQLQQATDMMKIMFTKYADYFDKEKDDHDTEL